ncbi:hypothetical protein [Pontibacter sp. G13]|uniref:Nmad3 family putative nucleotide modification protein n=1 Tax=Pontibacter sp. G13 TaxID=3074898 RepID=UPI00288BB0A9|nr:hypothetical protein [Pontibacter sp. G13]WNJ18590.1 hypothetical protein RJD25_27355 [Pontibacter sp. G13]
MHQPNPKLILSRKGFDSTNGGIPSPIVAGIPISLPIPQADTGIGYDEISFPTLPNMAMALRQLKAKHKAPTAHLDPDVFKDSIPNRHPDWKPIFGQHGAAWSHLLKEGVGVGDLFLFFGWFRDAEWEEGRLRFVPDAPDVHVLYGYLEVGEMWDLDQSGAPVWAAYHPHIRFREAYRGGNGLFVGAESSSFWEGKSGAGLWEYDPRRQLTADGARLRSQWMLPACFFDGVHCKLSYHRKREGIPNPQLPGYRRMTAVARGQEFVVEMNPEIRDWVCSLA